MLAVDPSPYGVCQEFFQHFDVGNLKVDNMSFGISNLDKKSFDQGNEIAYVAAAIWSIAALLTFLRSIQVPISLKNRFSQIYTYF
jgi:hypothetical protein